LRERERKRERERERKRERERERGSSLDCVRQKVVSCSGLRCRVLHLSTLVLNLSILALYLKRTSNWSAPAVLTRRMKR
jgi:hypothetical protein